MSTQHVIHLNELFKILFKLGIRYAVLPSHIHNVYCLRSYNWPSVGIQTSGREIRCCPY